MKDIIIVHSNRIEKQPVYININHIGHFYRTLKGYTNIGVTTHNNGGFDVKETVEEVIEMINEAQNKKIK